MPGAEEIYSGKIYLVKIKRDDDFNSEDFLWAICHVGKDNVDLEDFKNIVKVLNRMGLWSPMISDKPVKWKSLKNSVACKVLSVVGHPLLLLEEVNTFKQVLEVAYDRGVLTNPQGRDILDGKNEEQLGISSGSAASQSRPLSDVINDSSSRKNAISDMEKKTREAISAKQSSVTSQVPFPPPVSVSSSHSRRPSNLSEKEQSLVEQFDIAGLENNGDKAPPIGHDEWSVGTNGNGAPHVVPDGGSVGAVDGVFDPSKFNLDAIDNELAQLEASSGSDSAAMAKQLARYKTITKNLRESLVFSCMTVQKYQRLVDARDMQLRDSSSYSATDVIAGLKPTIARMEKVMESCLARDTKFSADVSNIQSELRDVRAAVESNATLSSQESENVVRHLGTFGMVDTGSTFDMPAAISAIYRTVNEDIAPSFRAGNVTTYVDPQTANPLESLLIPTGAVAAGPLVAGHKRPANVVAGQQATYCQMKTAPAPPANIGQRGILDLPFQYRDVATSYLGPSGFPANQQIGVLQQQQTPPQYAPPRSQHPDYSVPPPPIKQMRIDGASVVRSVFMNCQPMNTHVGYTAPGCSGDQMLGPRNLFQAPATPLASDTLSGPGSVTSENIEYIE